MVSQEPTAPSATTPDPERLSERFRDQLRVMAARRLGNWAEEEDAAQETLARVLEALAEGRLESADALPSFVFQTGRHVCQQWNRKRARGRRAVGRFALAAPRATPEVALWRLLSSERLVRARRALGRLSASDQELLGLLFRHALDRSAAAQLGITPGALRVRKHRALKRLERLLDEDL